MSRQENAGSFVEYAKIHKKMEIQAKLVSFNTASLHRVIPSEAGLKQKRAVMACILENMVRLRAWASRPGRPSDEVRIARSAYIQYQASVIVIENQIPTILEMLKGVSSAR